jgi:hypothetical protein
MSHPENATNMEITRSSSKGDKIQPLLTEAKSGCYVIEKDVLYRLLSQDFPNAYILICDNCYVIPDWYWFWEKHIPYTQSLLDSFKSRQTWDCDKYASYAAVVADITVYNMTNYKEIEGISIGEIHFQLNPPRPDSAHAANLLISVHDNKYKYTCYHAKAGERYTLSDAQRKSAWFIKF